jgi:hypothetical protein
LNALFGKILEMLELLTILEPLTPCGLTERTILSISFGLLTLLPRPRWSILRFQRLVSISLWI